MKEELFALIIVSLYAHFLTKRTAIIVNENKCIIENSLECFVSK